MYKKGDFYYTRHQLPEFQFLMQVKCYGLFNTSMNRFRYFMCPAQLATRDPNTYSRQPRRMKQRESIRISLANQKELSSQSERISDMECRFFFLLFKTSTKGSYWAPVTASARFTRSLFSQMKVIIAFPKFFGMFLVSFFQFLFIFLDFLFLSYSLTDSSSENSSNSDSSLGGSHFFSTLVSCCLTNCSLSRTFLFNSAMSLSSISFLIKYSSTKGLSSKYSLSLSASSRSIGTIKNYYNSIRNAQLS